MKITVIVQPLLHRGGRRKALPSNGSNLEAGVTTKNWFRFFSPLEPVLIFRLPKDGD
jgi:hypothetical protein